MREENLDTGLCFLMTRDMNESGFGAESPGMVMMYTLEVLVREVNKM